MKPKQATRKIDPKIIILLSLLIVGFLALYFIFPDMNKLDEKDLPESFDSNINKLVINEVMTNNSGVYVNENSEIVDYVELYNGTSKTINLQGYGLSDKINTIKWAFSDVEIGPNEYLVVALTGRLEAGNNAAFKLSSKGNEKLILTNPNAKVIDAVETVATSKNQVMVRDENGNWYLSNLATPGYSNTKLGHQAYIDSLQTVDIYQDLIITEILPNNKGNFLNGDNEYEGFIEVYNRSDKIIDLSEYCISNDLDIPFKGQLEDTLLQPNQYYVFYTTKASQDKKGYLGFSLDNKKGVVVLSYKGQIVQKIEYSDLANGKSLYLADDNNFHQSATVSPGYSNDDDGITAFQKKYCQMPTGLVISEAMNNNYSYLVQNSGNYYDWIEIYNNSTETINLAQYCLSTSDNDLSAYQLPEIELAAGDYYVIMCSGNTELTNNSYHHANFKLSEAESIYLTKNNKIVDAMFMADVPTGYSYGRVKDFGFNYMIPTPKQANNSGDRSIASMPEFLTSSGVYNDVEYVLVEIVGEGTIRYTTDGSIPTSSSPIYSQALKLKKTTVIKAASFKKGSRTSVANYASYIINENHTIPVMSLSMDESDYEYIIDNVWCFYQKQCYAEFFEEDSSFKIACGFAIFGGNARGQTKKSYSLRFRKRWGAGELQYQVFENRDCSSYDALVLRCGSTESSRSIIKDVVATSLMDEYSDVDVTAYKPCILYINGRYYGIYNLREKINGNMIESHYNVDASDADLFSLSGEVKQGSRNKYFDIIDFCNNNDLNVKENYDKLTTMINMDIFIDEWIAESYFANNDVVNVRYFFDDDIDEGRMHVIFYDLDYGWQWKNQNYYYTHLTNPQGIGIHYYFNNDILIACFKSQYFKQRWVERCSYLMKNCLNYDAICQRIDEIAAVYEPEMKRDRARWNFSYSYWKECLQGLKDFAKIRDKKFLTYTKNYCKLTDAQMKEYFGDLW